MQASPMTVEPLAFPVLLGDIGGTNARFALLSDAHAEPRVFTAAVTADHPDIETAIEETVLARTSLTPCTAVIALAGPVSGDEVDLTNAHWVVRPRNAMARLTLKDIVLLNDFEALALALPALPESDMEAIGGGQHDARGAKVVLGPGTGLGVAGLIHAANLWIPVPGEGGHVSFGPVEADEFAIFAAMEPEDGRISAEAVLAGRGLVRLYRAVAQVEGVAASLSQPAEVSEAGLSGGDTTARRTLELYGRLLGRLAGDMALTFMATGGVYLGGGIAPRLLPVLREGGFRRAFEAKAPHSSLMAAIPTHVITAPTPALTGLASFARTPSSFGVSLAGRRWRQGR
jgi:glucokinase